MGKLNPKIVSIGRLLKEEARRFVTYPEIEARTEELGFPTSVRTIRFYVDEGVLPPPQRDGKTPVYEEGAILNLLLSIHLMKTRFNRSLADIRTILRQQSEEPSVLADKCAALYEEYVKAEALPRAQAEALVEAFFAALLGGGSRRPQQASEVSIVSLARRVEEEAMADEKPQTPKDRAAEERKPLVTPVSLPEGAILVEKARALEELYVERFEARLPKLRKVANPLDKKVYEATDKTRDHVKRNKAGLVIEIMKKNKVYERELLDVLPLEECSEVQVYVKPLFGRKDVKVSIAAVALSPLWTFVTKRCATERLGALDLERAVREIAMHEDVFYYIGALSTVGWEAGTERHLPSASNVLCCLVENRGGTHWTIHRRDDKRWNDVDRLFDPETDREKVDRAKRYLVNHPELRLRGGFVAVKAAEAEAKVPEDLFRQALEEVCSEDKELSLLTVGGKEILKRRRL